MSEDLRRREDLPRLALTTDPDGIVHLLHQGRALGLFPVETGAEISGLPAVRITIPAYMLSYVQYDELERIGALEQTARA